MEWSECAKLVQLKIRLNGRAERLFEVLADQVKMSHSSAVEASSACQKGGFIVRPTDEEEAESGRDC